MVFEPKCILVTGATSDGIGKALAQALLELPSSPNVIITGRRDDRLQKIAASHDRLHGKKLDQTWPRDQLKSWVGELLSEHPDIDTVILNAGVQYLSDLSKPEESDLEKLEQEVYTNYTSPMILSHAFVPHFVKLAKEGKQVPRLVTVTSGLAVVPNPTTQNYSATKAALHSLTLAMRATLAKSGVKVIEVLPPLVESELHSQQGTEDFLKKMWMPLKDFVEATMKGLTAEQEIIPVGMAEKDYTEHEAGKDKKTAQRIRS